MGTNSITVRPKIIVTVVQKPVISYGTTSGGAYVADVIMKYVAFQPSAVGNFSVNVNFVYERESDNSACDCGSEFIVLEKVSRYL